MSAVCGAGGIGIRGRLKIADWPATLEAPGYEGSSPSPRAVRSSTRIIVANATLPWGGRETRAAPPFPRACQARSATHQKFATTPLTVVSAVKNRDQLGGTIQSGNAESSGVANTEPMICPIVKPVGVSGAPPWSV